MIFNSIQNQFLYESEWVERGYMIFVHLDGILSTSNGVMGIEDWITILLTMHLHASSQVKVKFRHDTAIVCFLLH